MSTDAIGEYYSLCELLLAGKEAYLANGATQKGWDILVLENNKTIRIQVKCIDWKAKGQSAIKGMFYNKEFDYLVIVVLNLKDVKFTPFIFEHKKLKEKNNNERNTLIDEKGHLYFSKRNDKKPTEKQTIAISTLKKEDILTLFNTHSLKFESIK